MTISDPDRAPEASLHDLHDLVLRLQRRLRSSFGADAFLYDAVGLAAGLVPSGSAALTVVRDGKPMAAAASDEVADDMNALQLRHDAGPSLAALRTNAYVEVADTSFNRQWEAFSDGALLAGLRSAAVAPMVLDGSVLGSVTVYSTRPSAFPEAFRDSLELLADQVAYAWSILTRQSELEAANQQLMNALASRPIIDQAIGILMGQSECTASSAFEMLRRHARNNNRKLRDVAAEIVTRASGTEPEDPHGFAFNGSTLTDRVDGRASTGRLLITEAAEAPGLRLTGEADSAVYATLRDALAGLFARPPAVGQDLVVDVEELSFIDVACMRLLVQAADLADQRGSRLVLRSPSATFLRILELTWGSPESVHLGIEAQR